MKCIFVHGFNSDGAAGLLRWQQPLEQLGWEVARLEYANHLGILQDLLRVRLRNGDRAKRLMELCGPASGNPPGRSLGGGNADVSLGGGNAEVVVAAHSNGATIALLAAEAGAKMDRLVLFNPALSSTFTLPKQVRRCDVFACSKDWAVWFGGLLPLHRWGWLGRAGYRGEDARVVTWHTAEGKVQRGGEAFAIGLPGFRAEQHAIGGHSAIFEDWSDAGYWWFPYAIGALIGRTGYWAELG